LNPVFTRLEEIILEAILQGVPEYEAALRLQLESATLESRDHNGYGFYTTFVISHSLPTIDFSGRLHASAYLCDQLCNFMLWVKDGRADFLEGYPLGADEWPSEEKIEKVTFGSVDANSIH